MHIIQQCNKVTNQEHNNPKFFSLIRINLTSSLIIILTLFYRKPMGACSSCSKQKKEVLVRDSFDQEPEDTYGLADVPLPKLLFSALLTKIKIKRCIYPSISMKFQIKDVEQFMIPQKDVSGQVVKWDVEHVFRFQITEYEMRKKFLVITFYDKEKTEVGFLKINLFLLANGPFHQDFAINLKDDPSARLSFNLKIAQIIKMKFQFLEAQMIPNQKEYPGDKFTFSVRSIMGNVTAYTKQSYVISIAFDEEEEENQKKNQKTNEQSSEVSKKKPKLKSKTTIMANLKGHEIEVDRNHLKWSKQKLDEMPSFDTEIALFDMHSSAFHIIYWKLPNSAQTTQEDVTAECYVSINKLLNFESKVIYDGNVPYEQRLITLQQNNWSHGKEVGKSNFTIKFSIQKHMKQMQVCVRTQQGILKSSPVFSRDQSRTASNKEMNALSELSAKIDSQFLELAKNRKQNGSTLQFRRSVDSIISMIKESKILLQTTVKESIMFFNYKDEKELLKAQQELLEVAFKTKTYINENIDEISSACFSLLSAMMKRGELSLAHLGFNVDKMSSSNDLSPNSFKNKKIYIALKYQELLNELMNLTLFSLNFKGQESEKEFAQLFCALAYFRIPQFRKHVLQTISRPDDPQIQQWRGTEFNLYDRGESKLLLTAGEEKNTYELLFDWENNFYKFIETQDKYKQNIHELEQILEENEWEKRINKRKGAFFSFVQYWCDYVESIAVNSKNLKWKHFPGYNRILHAFLVEMKNTDLIDFTDRFDKALASLLNNEKLLNTFVVILFKKADVNDSSAILKMLNYLELFFSAINKKNRLIPPTFDYTYFFKGFKMVLESSHCYSLGKALLLLYNHYSIFSQEFRYTISMYLMGKLFFRLFLHWSFNVRTIFHHLLYIRFNKMTQFSNKNTKFFSRHEKVELRERYDKLMRILENASELKKKEMKVEKVREEKDLYKRMKKKLYQKKNFKKFIKDQDEDTSISMKELSYNPRKNSLNDERLIEQLSRPKLERYNSEVMNQNLKIAIQEAQNKKDEIIILKPKTQIDQSDIYLTERKDSSDNKDVRRINLLTEEDSQIWQMTKKESEYLEKSLVEYGNIHELFLKHLAKNNNADSVPTVKLEIAYDYEDIRPERLDEW